MSGRLVACVLGVVVAARGSTHAGTPPSSVDPAARLRAALRAKDVAAVVKLLRDPVQHHGVWFTDEACAEQFGTPGRVSGADLVALAQCLVQLELQATSRWIDARDRAVLTYEPGIELDVAFDHGRVSALAFSYDSEWRHGPMLTVQAFEALRSTGSPNIDAAVSERLAPRFEKVQVMPMRAWMMVCTDGTGALSGVAAVKRYPPYEHAIAVTDAFHLAMRTWTFRPFELNGRVTPACSLMLLSYPAASGSPVESLPYSAASGSSVEFLPGAPLPGSGVEPSKELLPDALAGRRISGESYYIPPHDVTIAEMQRLNGAPVTSSFQLCVDARGTVTRIAILESSGFPDYDGKIQREMHQWRFKPYRVRGRPAATCAPVSFRYEPPPPPRQSCVLPLPR